MTPEFVCTSCNTELKKSYKLCFNCFTSKHIKNCSFIKKNGEQCKNRTISEFCIYHNKDTKKK